MSLLHTFTDDATLSFVRKRCDRAYYRARRYCRFNSAHTDSKRDLWWLYIERIDEIKSVLKDEKKIFKTWTWDEIVLPNVSFFCRFIIHAVINYVRRNSA